MNVFKLFIYYPALIAVISGCATGPKVPDPDLSALQYCDADGKGHEGGADFALLDMSESRLGQIRLIDGKPFKPGKCNYHRIVLAPTKHTVHFVYLKSLYLLHPRGRDPVALSFNAESGKTYSTIVTKHPLKSLYNCRIVDTSSGKIIVEIKDCDDDSVRYPALNEILEVFGGRDEYLKYQSEWWPDDDFDALHDYLR